METIHAKSPETGPSHHRAFGVLADKILLESRPISGSSPFALFGAGMSPALVRNGNYRRCLEADAVEEQDGAWKC